MSDPVGWYVFTLAPRHRRRTLIALRSLGIDVVRLMCFAEVRAHRSVKARRANMRKPVDALGDYVFVHVAYPGQWDVVATWGEGLSRLRLGDGYAPRLSAAGAAWIERPPRELFFDTSVPVLAAASADLNVPDRFKAGDWVTVLSHGFDGLQGEVVSVRSGRARVRFIASLLEVDVRCDAAAPIDPPEGAAKADRKARRRAASRAA
jgi:transcription antitermination factor NusG